jgi:hypothetical protein
LIGDSYYQFIIVNILETNHGNNKKKKGVFDR